MPAVQCMGQGVVEQDSIRTIIDSQGRNAEFVTQVRWQVYTIEDTGNITAELTAVLAAIPGCYTASQRLMIVELANRIRARYLKKRQKILVPVCFYQDYKSYSPYPFYYVPATALPKLFVIDKFTQTFGAYENGRLVRWGLVSSGRRNNLTPPGRYNFNWKTYFKLSNAAPPGETWKMYWVFDFYSKIGLHVHQYDLPIGRAASHGCVRVCRADAEWNYAWANGWEHNNSKLVRNGTPVMVINNNPGPHVAHWSVTAGGEVISLVKLPAALDEVPIRAIEQKVLPWESGW